MKYQVVWSMDSTFLSAKQEVEQKVNQLSQEGWEPQGGVSVALSDSGLKIVTQAMIKK